MNKCTAVSILSCWKYRTSSRRVIYTSRILNSLDLIIDPRVREDLFVLGSLSFPALYGCCLTRAHRCLRRIMVLGVLALRYLVHTWTHFNCVIIFFKRRAMVEAECKWIPQGAVQRCKGKSYLQQAFFFHSFFQCFTLLWFQWFQLFLALLCAFHVLYTSLLIGSSAFRPKFHRDLTSSSWHIADNLDIIAVTVRWKWAAGSRIRTCSTLLFRSRLTREVPWSDCAPELRVEGWASYKEDWRLRLVHIFSLLRLHCWCWLQENGRLASKV